MPPSARVSALDRPALPAAILALGLVLGGWLIGYGFLRGRSADRYVEVKGLAEHEVTADLALWPLRYVATGDNLAVAQAGLTRSTRQVFAFLTRYGIDTTAVQLQALEVSDALPIAFPASGAARASSSSRPSSSAPGPPTWSWRRARRSASW
jgi:hypothetical protein